jgi:hypothetical protein
VLWSQRTGSAAGGPTGLNAQNKLRTGLLPPAAVAGLVADMRARLARRLSRHRSVGAFDAVARNRSAPAEDSPLVSEGAAWGSIDGPNSRAWTLGFARPETLIDNWVALLVGRKDAAPAMTACP